MCIDPIAVAGGVAGLRLTHRLNVSGVQGPGRGQLSPLVPLRGSSSPRHNVTNSAFGVGFPPRFGRFQLSGKIDTDHRKWPIAVRPAAEALKIIRRYEKL